MLTHDNIPGKGRTVYITQSIKNINITKLAFNKPDNKNQSTQFRPREMNQPKDQQQQMHQEIGASLV